MKKLVNSGLGRRSMLLCIMAALFSLTAASVKAQGCDMTCAPSFPPVQINLPQSCSDIVTPGDLQVTLAGCNGPITVDIYVNGVSVGNVATYDMVGDTLMVIITDEDSGQTCMTQITVADGQSPTLTCPPNVTVDCNTDLQEYNDLEPGDIVDCSDTEVFIEDSVIFSGNCMGNIISQIYREYIVVDEFLNADTCVQIISLAKANIADVEFPPDLTGLDAIPCFPTPDVSPENTGYPSVFGDEILNGMLCNLSAGFTDLIVPICSGSYKIMRTWTVIDWCNPDSTVSGVQVIEVLDITPPDVTAPADFTVSTSALDCTADVSISAAIVSDDCSTIINVRMSTPVGTIFSNGGIIPDLPVGVHRIIFIATSDCQLEGRDTTYVNVQDLQPPVPVCNQALTVPVNNLGFALLPAYIFNAASYDNCGDVYFKVRRMSLPADPDCLNPGNPNNLFDDVVQFCCADIANSPIMVVLRVYDVPPIDGPVSSSYLQGHFNDCMIFVEVQDKLPPQLICPTDLTISCEFPFTPGNLDVFGTVVLAEEDREQICINDPGYPGNPGIQCVGLDGLATDNCFVTVEDTAFINVNNCGLGSIQRIFTATDAGGLTSTCVQNISIINYDPFSIDDITWPQNFMTTDICDVDLLDPEDLDPPFSEPILNDGPCDLVGITYDDDVFDFSNGDEACFKILRTWQVIDWCQYNPPYTGIWTHLQVIKAVNNVAPVIAEIDDISECSFDPDCGGLELELTASADDDCSGPASLTWKYYIDLNDNNSFDFISNEITDSTITFSFEFPIGSHRVLYTVWDQCGNISTAEQNVTIESCKAPSAKCFHGLSTNLMAMDLNGDGEADWGMVVLQAEMFDAGSDHPCGNPISVAFSADPLDVTRVFDCEDLGPNEIELWAIDQNGLTDFCITTVDIQDNNNVCPPGNLQSGIISGDISVPGSGKLSGATVYLEGNNQDSIQTNTNGYFVFPAMPFGNDYVVRPVREGDARNGVTTLDLVQMQKHLLGIKTFTSPHQYIAADVNNSASVTAVDILQLRKLILGYYSSFPNNSSWRFVDKGHIFPDPHNPWLTAWPETYKIIPFSASMNEVDFDAIKIGDLNLNASLAIQPGIILPRSPQTCHIEYAVTQEQEEGIVRVDLLLENANQYNALQFSFDWNQFDYQLIDWIPGPGLSAEEIYIPGQPGGVASLSTFTLDQWTPGQMNLVTMWFKSASTHAYPFQLYLKNMPTIPVAYSTDTEEECNVIIGQSDQIVSKVENRPNPFKEVTTIYYNSQLKEEAVLRVYDINGQLVHTRKLSLLKGENEFLVQKHEVGSTGMYVYEIKSNNQFSANRMIIVE